MKLLWRGKVRDIYELDEQHLLMVTSDRLSAFDVVLPTPVPGKGAILTRLTRFWMEKFVGIVRNHLLDPAPFESARQQLFDLQPEIHPEQTEVVRKAEVFPIECVVRGYLAGSGWKDYQATQSICGLALPAGLVQCDALAEPLFTPSTKAHVGHDENITLEQAANLVGKETAAKLAELSIALYLAGKKHAIERGIIISDTKFEFGLIDGEICVVDEVLTPDSSRFWPADSYEPGHDQPSFDKQIVRNYLMDIGWDRTPPAPALPFFITEKTSQAYREILTRLTS